RVESERAFLARRGERFLRAVGALVAKKRRVLREHREGEGRAKQEGEPAHGERHYTTASEGGRHVDGNERAGKHREVLQAARAAQRPGGADARGFKGKQAGAGGLSRRRVLRVSELLVSADSHVMEPVDLWKTRVPEKYREAAPLFPPHKLGEGFQQRQGGHDPHARIKEMEVDGLSAEVLYPTLMLGLFGLHDAGLQEACFRA